MVNLADGVLCTLVVACVALIAVTCDVAGQAADEPVFFTQEGTDRPWRELLDAKAIPIGRNSTDGITGAKVTLLSMEWRRALATNCAGCGDCRFVV